METSNFVSTGARAKVRRGTVTVGDVKCPKGQSLTLISRRSIIPSSVRIRAEFGTAEFDAEYQAAISGSLRQKRGGPATDTLAYLLQRYRETTAWTELSPATRRQRENIFKHVLEASGDRPFARINQTHIVAGRDRRAATPAQARNFLDAMRGLFRWAKEAQLVKIDPTAGVKNPKRKKGQGIEPWNEDNVAAYERRYPLGTKERVWLDVQLYTGSRRGDAVTLGRQHIRETPEGDVLTFRTEKAKKKSRSASRSCRCWRAH